MEAQKERKVIQVPKFFKGLASMKFHGQLSRSLLKSYSLDQVFSLDNFYDITIQGVQQIDRAEYYSLKSHSSYIVDAYQESIILKYNSNAYDFKPDELVVLENPKLDHSQVEGDETFGYFKDVEVIFIAHRPEEREVFIQDSPTGNVVRLDRNGFKTEYYNQDGSTYWVETPPTCIQGALTGEREDDSDRFRLEYFNADCSTYWGDWQIKKKEEQKKAEKKESMITDNPLGCFGGLISILIGAYFLIQIVGFIWSGAWMIFLLYAGIIGFFILIGWLINLLSRLPRLVKGFGIGLSWIWNLLFVFVLIQGINGLISRNNWKSDNEYTPNYSESDSKQEVREVPYQPSPYDVNDSNLDSPELITPDEKLIEVSLKWKGLDGKKYEGSYKIFESDKEKSASNLKRLENIGVQSYASLYKNVSVFDIHKLKSVYVMLDSIKSTNNQSHAQFAQTIVSMIQSIEYVLIVDESCEEAKSTWAEKMNLEGVKCSGFAPFGIKTPLEFLTSLEGDCDTRTITLYTILKHYGYDVAILNSTVYTHSMLGLNIPGGRGSYKRLGGKKYYFWETTSTGFRLGYLPKETGNTNFWDIEIN